MSGISFKIKSTQENSSAKKLNETEKEIIFSLEDQKIQSSRLREDKKAYVVPLIKKNRWKTDEIRKNIIEQNKSEEEIKLEKLAAQEILEECKSENSREENINSENKVIPLLFQNKPPEGFETDKKLDVSLRPDVSSLENYEQMPVNEYGKAILRGMGWKVGEGIGLNKKIVKPKEVTHRPKLVGLGFDLSKYTTNASKKEEGSELKLIKGAYVYIEEGAHKGSYGEVESFDEENGSVLVKLAPNNQNVTISELFIKVVSASEFKKGRKVLNNVSYKKCKSTESKDQKIKDQNPFESFKSEYIKDENGEKFHKKQLFQERTPMRSFWVQPQLKVRFIDKDYKNGRYFKTKFIIEDVVSKDMCVCKTEDGRLLDDISPEMLETVIPRSQTSYIMVVHGEYKGQIGTIVKRDKPSCIATVQLLTSQTVHEFDYDFICEYVGEPIY